MTGIADAGEKIDHFEACIGCRAAGRQTCRSVGWLQIPYRNVGVLQEEAQKALIPDQTPDSCCSRTPSLVVASQWPHGNWWGGG